MLRLTEWVFSRVTPIGDAEFVEPVHWHQTPTIATGIPRNGGLVATVSVIGLMQRGPVLASLAPYGIRPHRSKSGKRRIFRYRSVPADASRH